MSSGIITVSVGNYHKKIGICSGDYTISSRKNIPNGTTYHSGTASNLFIIPQESNHIFGYHNPITTQSQRYPINISFIHDNTIKGHIINIWFTNVNISNDNLLIKDCSFEFESINIDNPLPTVEEYEEYLKNIDKYIKLKAFW